MSTPVSPPPVIGSGYEGGIGDQVVNYFRRVRQGEMGALPALGGFVVLIILFSFLSGNFFTPLNLANLLTQTATLMTLAMALVFVILLGGIDLSAGVTSGVTASVFVVLVHNIQMNWILALLIAFVVGMLIGTFIGFFVARVGIRRRRRTGTPATTSRGPGGRPARRSTRRPRGASRGRGPRG